MNFFLVPKSQSELPCLLETPGSQALCRVQILALALYQTAVGTRMIMETNQCMKLKSIPYVFLVLSFPKGAVCVLQAAPPGFSGRGKLGSAARTLTFQGQLLKLRFPLS